MPSRWRADHESARRGRAPLRFGGHPPPRGQRAGRAPGVGRGRQRSEPRSSALGTRNQAHAGINELPDCCCAPTARSTACSRACAHSRDMLERTTVENLQVTHDKLAEVTSATEVAATDILDGLDRSLALIDRLDEEEGRDPRRGARRAARRDLPGDGPPAVPGHHLAAAELRLQRADRDGVAPRPARRLFDPSTFGVQARGAWSGAGPSPSTRPPPPTTPRPVRPSSTRSSGSNGAPLAHGRGPVPGGGRAAAAASITTRRPLRVACAFRLLGHQLADRPIADSPLHPAESESCRATPRRHRAAAPPARRPSTCRQVGEQHHGVELAQTHHGLVAQPLRARHGSPCTAAARGRASPARPARPAIDSSASRPSATARTRQPAAASASPTMRRASASASADQHAAAADAGRCARRRPCVAPRAAPASAAPHRAERDRVAGSSAGVTASRTGGVHRPVCSRSAASARHAPYSGAARRAAPARARRGARPAPPARRRRSRTEHARPRADLPRPVARALRVARQHHDARQAVVGVAAVERAAARAARRVNSAPGPARSPPARRRPSAAPAAARSAGPARCRRRGASGRSPPGRTPRRSGAAAPAGCRARCPVTRTSTRVAVQP
jgi:hypothetical protein